MKFICQNCNREFDIGAPKGLQLPCPACGGMLADEESAGGAPQAAAPEPPAPPAAPEPEFSMDAAESYASAPPEPEPQEEYQPEEAYQEPAAESQEEEYQEQEYQAEYDEAAGPEQEAQPEIPAEEPAPAYDESEEAAEEEEEEEEEFEEAEAGAFIVWLGWILFVLAFAGILVMAYFLMMSHNLAEEGRKANEVRQDNDRLLRQLREQTDALNKQQELRQELEAKSAEKAEQIAAHEARIAELSRAAERLGGSTERLQDEFERTARALREAKADLLSLRDRAESAELTATRAGSRLTAITQALRAVELVYVPSRWAEALGYLESAVAADEQLDIAWWMRGRILARAGRFEEAIAAFERVDQIARDMGGSGNAKALYAAGEIVRLGLRNNRRAADIYHRAAEAAPESPMGILASLRHLTLTGGASIAQDRLNPEIEKIEAAGGDSSGFLLLKAELLAAGAADSRGEAIEAVSRAIGANPNHIPALDLRAELLLKNDDAQAAVIDLIKAAELDPADGRRLVRLGGLLVDLGRITTAEPVLRRAVEALPNSVEARLALGRALVELNRFPDAVTVLADVLHMDNVNAEAFRLRGRARVALQQYREGLHDLEESLRIGSDDADVRVLLARTYASAQQQAIRNVTKAIENAQAAVQLTNARDAEALATLASAYAAGGDFARAQIEIRRAIRLAPENESYAAALRAYERRQGGM